MSVLIVDPETLLMVQALEYLYQLPLWLLMIKVEKNVTEIRSME